ncbi:MAG: hypothetical protein ACYS0H_12925 [Planctomycetota bacterium]|jgi:hypothetical protein
MRKLLIGFVSLGGVLAVYLLYTGVSDSPVIEDDPGAEFIETIADSNTGDFDPNVGKIGDIGIGRADLAEFITRNKETREVEQISGFKTLLSKERGLWEVEKPYINVFEPEFTCYITADSGLVQMESAAGRMTPKDATFTGNVVIHVSPKESSELTESFVYLDDVVILSERSQISTKGPVEYVSDDVRMRGRGLEVIYNDQDDRIEFFRIVDLEELRIRNYQTAMFAMDEPPADESGEVAALAETEQPVETVAVAGPDKTEESTAEAVAATEPNDGVYYKCILSKNVLIDTPDELIFADQRIRISDIFWSRDSIASDPNDANDAEVVAVAGEEEPASDSNSVVADEAGDPNVTVLAAVEPKAFSEEPEDVVITCDNGLVLVPMDTRRPLDEFMQASAGSGTERPAVFESDNERTKFLALRIDYNRVTGDVVADGLPRLTLYSADANEPPVPMKISARDEVHFFQATNEVVFKGECLGSMPQKGLTEPRDVEFQSPEIAVELTEDKSVRPDVVAAGPARLTFYVQDANDPNAVKGPTDPIPVTVTAQKQVRFSGAKNQIDFEDECICMTTREDPNGVTKHMLMSELITVKLLEDANDRSSDLAGGIEKLTASGGVVRLVSTATANTDPNLAGHVGDINGPEILGGVEVKCSLVEYDPGLGVFEASGAPGEIQMDNSRVTVSERDPNGFSLRGPCYAFLANFESLKYFIDENRIVAQAAPGDALWLHHVPVVDGAHDLDSITTASAPRVEAFLVKTPDGRTQLSTLRATGGIDVNDLSNGNHFLGSVLYYDHETSIMRVTGDESQPCLCNGAFVDEIEYNVTTGDLEGEVVGPGPMQTDRQ